MLWAYVTFLNCFNSEGTKLPLQELLYELAHQPLIQTKMRAELAAFETANGGPPSPADLSASSRAGLEYFNAVIMETLRCKAVLMDIAREVRYVLYSYEAKGSNHVHSRRR